MKKTLKTVKQAKKPCKKPCGKSSREDIRQKARVAAIIKEAKSVLGKIDALRKVMDSDRFRDMPSIDRHIVAIMFSALESYATALAMKADWENVRLRTALGDQLHTSPFKFVEFLFGGPTTARFTKFVNVKKA